MKAFLATVLSVIAVGVLLIAYGLLTERTSFAAVYPGARPMVASQRVGLIDDGYALPQTAQYGYAARPAVAYPVGDVRALPDSHGRRQPGTRQPRSCGRRRCAGPARSSSARRRGPGRQRRW